MQGCNSAHGHWARVSAKGLCNGARLWGCQVACPHQAVPTCYAEEQVQPWDPLGGMLSTGCQPGPGGRS